MGNEERFPSIMFVLVFGTAFGFLVAEMVNDVISLNQLIYRYQALITGILALVAAVLTVSQMQSSDRMQETRHKEMVGLSLRPDALLIERAAVPGLGLLDQAINSSNRLLEFTETKSQADFAKDSNEVHAKFLSFQRQMNDLSQLQQFSDAKRIFSPDAFLFHTNLISMIERFNQSITQMYGAQNVREVDRIVEMKRENPFLMREQWKTCVEQIRFNCIQLKKSIERMRKDYESAGVTFVG